MRRKCSKTPTKPKNIYFVHHFISPVPKTSFLKRHLSEISKFCPKLWEHISQHRQVCRLLAYKTRWQPFCDDFWSRKILVIFGLIRVAPVVPKKKISSDRHEKFRHAYSMCPHHAVKISTRSDHSLYHFALIKTDGQTDIQPASQPDIPNLVALEMC